MVFLVSEINKQSSKGEININQKDSPKGEDPKVVFKQLSLQIEESPNDLKRHVQRILFCIDSNLTELISGALYDLFVVLDGKGMDLCIRMFGIVSPILDFNNRAYFHQWLSEGTDKNLDCHHFEGALFQSENCKPQNA